MLKGLKAFLLRGDALALAVGVVIGGAFNNIINALVTRLFSPLIGAIVGGIDFSTSSWTLVGIEIGWGSIVQALINFIMVGVSLYAFLRIMGKNPNETPPPTKSEVLLTEIRDLLKERA
jgi:large conductance mechanosensitive channel